MLILLIGSTDERSPDACTTLSSKSMERSKGKPPLLPSSVTDTKILKGAYWSMINNEYKIEVMEIRQWTIVKINDKLYV